MEMEPFNYICLTFRIHTFSRNDAGGVVMLHYAFCQIIQNVSYT